MSRPVHFCCLFRVSFSSVLHWLLTFLRTGGVPCCPGLPSQLLLRGAEWCVGLDFSSRGSLSPQKHQEPEFYKVGARTGGVQPQASVQAQACLPKKENTYNSDCADVFPKKDFHNVHQYHEEGLKRKKGEENWEEKGNEEKI